MTNNTQDDQMHDMKTVAAAGAVGAVIGAGTVLAASALQDKSNQEKIGDAVDDAKDAVSNAWDSSKQKADEVKKKVDKEINK